MPSRAGPAPLLTQAQVDELRIQYRTGKYTLKQLAQTYSISERTAYMYIYNPLKKGS